MTISLLPQTAFLFMLMFARLGTLVMLMPAIGERTMPARIRLSLALAITLVLYPAVSRAYPAMPASFAGVVTALAGELMIGFGIGLIARMITTSLQTAGTTIAFQMGLGFALSVDPSQGQQGALIGNFLTIMALTMIFVTDLHHLVLAALYDSYTMFRPGETWPVGDFSAAALQTITETFVIGIQIAAPFIVFGLIFNLGLGILSRLMPQLQIFFIAMPASITVGFILLMFLIGAVMMWYLDHVETLLGRFVVH